MVTVSDGLHTSAPGTITVAIPQKITVCHKGQLISVSKMAAIGHIQHGDCIGTCATGEVIAGNSNPYGEESLADNIQVYPNPAKGKINISLGNNAQHIRNIQFIDLSGRVVKQIKVNRESSFIIPSDKLHGMYVVKMIGDKILTQKIMIE
jgi:hypothetical protein